jgi:hypothetical protein
MFRRVSNHRYHPYLDAEIISGIDSYILRIILGDTPSLRPFQQRQDQNHLSFPSPYSLSLSWNLKIQESFNITEMYNILETIKEFIYIYSLVFYRTIYM